MSTFTMEFPAAAAVLFRCPRCGGTLVPLSEPWEAAVVQPSSGASTIAQVCSLGCEACEAYLVDAVTMRPDSLPEGGFEDAESPPNHLNPGETP